jgi:hypothetical protein
MGAVVEKAGSDWVGRIERRLSDGIADGSKVDFNAEVTECAEIVGRAKNGSKDPPLQRQERRRRGPNM